MLKEDLTNEQKAIILSKFVEKIKGVNKVCGTVYGSFQILDMIEDIAIEEKFMICPKCKR